MSRSPSRERGESPPKRRRLSSHGINTPQYDATGDAALAYAYDDDNNSDAFDTPKQDSEEETEVKTAVHERPRRLNYVPHMTLRGHKLGVTAVKYSPNGNWIASSCRTSLDLL